MNKRKFLLYAVLSISLLFNGLVVYFDVIPTIYPKIQDRFMSQDTFINKQITTEEMEQRIFESGKNMLISKKPVTVFQENNGFTASLLQKRHVTAAKEFQLDNYPRVFLFAGLFDYTKTNKQSMSLKDLQNYFDEEVINSKYEIRRIDQVPLGLIALNLYQSSGEQKYLIFSQQVFEYLNSLLDEDGILSYREGQTVLYYDALGLAVPFLVKYAEIVDTEVINIARKQIEFYVSYGLHSTTFIPSHAVNKKLKTPVGSSNWGRGIGWYILGLSSFHKATGEFEKEYHGLLNVLKELRNKDELWGQFPGSKDQFDASASLLFIYAELLNNPIAYTKEQLLNLLSPFISIKGEVLDTSGDTYGANYYSRSFGKSELSQGLLLSILSFYRAIK